MRAVLLVLAVLLATHQSGAQDTRVSDEFFDGDRPFYEHIRQFPISYWWFQMNGYPRELTPEFELELESRLNLALKNGSSKDALDLATIWSLYRAFQREDTVVLDIHALSAWPTHYRDLTTTPYQRAGFYFGLSEYRLERLVGCPPAEAALMRELSLSSTQLWPGLVESRLSDLEPDFLYRLESLIDWDAEDLLDERNWTIALVGDLIGAIQDKETGFRLRLNRHLAPGTLSPVNMAPDPRTMANSEESRAYYHHPPYKNYHRRFRLK